MPDKRKSYYNSGPATGSKGFTTTLRDEEVKSDKIENVSFRNDENESFEELIKSDKIENSSFSRRNDENESFKRRIDDSEKFDYDTKLECLYMSKM